MNFIKNLIKALFCFYVLTNANLTHAAYKWHMVNVNNNTQGDAHLLETNGVWTLIDAGQFQEVQNLIDYLRRLGVAKIDNCIVSHPHDDHYNGFIALMDAGIICKRLYHNRMPAGLGDFAYNEIEYQVFIFDVIASGGIVIDVKKFDKIELTKDSYIKILHAQKERTFPDALRVSTNDYSIIMRWELFGRRILFTGDLNSPLGEILSADIRMEADILKVPHHGVTGIAPDSFFDKVNPQLAMAPMPWALWLIDRSEQFRLWLADNPGVVMCANGFSGDIVLSFTENGYSVLHQWDAGNCISRFYNWNPREFQLDDDEKPISMMPILMLLLEE